MISPSDAPARRLSRAALRRRLSKIRPTRPTRRQAASHAATPRNVALDSAEVGDGRKGYPVQDVAAAGGWKTEEVLVTS